MPGYIFNIQRFCTHDGPGIRTSVFLKGCPLSCCWCHNPESQHITPQITYTHNKCLNCRFCFHACPTGSLTAGPNSPTIRPELCQHCGACHLACPSEALQLIGRQVSSEEVMAELVKDRVFYDESGGGVTFSGGEPLTQPEFLLELLQVSRSQGLHTAIDTSGHAPFSVLAKVAPLTDLFLYDIKHMNSHKHHELAGVPNDLILSNLRQLVKTHAQVFLRVPIIPGCNDDRENLLETRDLALELSISRVHLLPYHAIGSGKYESLGLTNRLQGVCPPTEEHMMRLAGLLHHPSLEIKIGG